MGIHIRGRPQDGHALPVDVEVQMHLPLRQPGQVVETVYQILRVKMRDTDLDQVRDDIKDVSVRVKVH